MISRKKSQRSTHARASETPDKNTAWGSRLVAKILTAWHTLLTAIRYYASMRVIFHTELALIMLCLVDLTINCTALIILISISSTTAHKYTTWAISPDKSYASKHFWDELFTLTQALYLVESINRIYYCLKLAYHHDKKIKEGDLCCMKCHEPLMSANISSVYALPHFISSVANIVYFIVAYTSTAVETMQSHRDYFASSPFLVDRLNSSSSVAMETSMYYKMATQVLANDIGTCRLNKNETMESTVRQLLSFGKIDSVVDYKCALSVVHCKHARYYLQLTFESVLALVNYTVIRTLFSHVINMHQYEVYNQQTRLQTGGGSRIIRVYKVRHRKARRQSLFSSGIVQLPRQALRSIINLGSNLSAKIRRSSSLGKSEARLSTPEVLDAAAQQQEAARISFKDILAEMPINEIKDLQLNTVDTESDYATWSKKGAELQTEDKESAASSASGQQPPDQVFNRRGSTVARKVNFQQYRISNLIPLNEDATGSSSKPDGGQVENGGGLAQVPPVQSTGDALTATTPESLLRVEAESYDSENDSPKDLPPVVGKKIPTAAKGKKNDNDTIFTDETFYSLET